MYATVLCVSLAQKSSSIEQLEKSWKQFKKKKKKKMGTQEQVWAVWIPAEICETDD